MKNKVALLLLFILLYSFGGFYIVFKIQQSNIRREIKHTIKSHVPDSQLKILSFNVSSEEYKKLDWKDKHEFRYKGRMYDIVKQKTLANGQIQFYCIDDEDEEKLFENLETMISHRLKESSESFKHVEILLFSHLYISEKNTQWFYTENSSPLFQEEKTFLSFMLDDKTTPPPENYIIPRKS